MFNKPPTAVSMPQPQRLLPLLTTSLALLAYTLTLAPDYTWAYHSADSGDLITAAYTLGIPHPPGYPTYVWLGYALAHQPFGSPIIAVRFHLLSAISLALAAGLLTAVAQHLLRDFPPRTQLSASLTAGFLFAFTPLVWQQAIVAEVYALNAALLTAVLWTTLTRKPAWLVGLLAGLSSTTHLTSLLMWPLIAALLPRRDWPQAGAGLLLGLAPWLSLFWLGQSDSPVVWGDPTTLSGWWWLVSATLYRPNLFAAQDVAARLVGWWWLWGMAALGLVAWRLAPANQRRFVGLALSTAVLYLLYALGYAKPDALVLTLPALLLLNSCLAFLWTKGKNTAVLLPLILLALNWSPSPLTQSAQQPSPRQQVQATLPNLPPKAIVLTSGGDQTIFALWYFQHVEGWRPDLIIVDTDLFAFDWYRQRIQQRYPQLKALAEDDLPGFSDANQPDHPICTLTLTPEATAVCLP
ncbi:MAG: DUF2723 domain-containing protein [Anaerolineales bacterium]|nr:DUF2723 domain-containing protein [Anaerolineales bacterium]